VDALQGVSRFPAILSQPILFHSLVISMFKILRRISSSIYPRPDRPWSDDATSNAPSIGRKRKMNDEDEDVQESGSARKRRGELERQDTSELGELAAKGSKGSGTDPGVKEVTRGVKEVELEDKEEGGCADDGKSAAEEPSKRVDGDGESSLGDPLDLVDAPRNDDSPSPDITATDDNVPGGQTETAAETEDPSSDPPLVQAPTSTDISEPPSPAKKEEGPSDDTPEARSEEVTEAKEFVEPIPEP